MLDENLYLGIDIGSTTVKVVVLNEKNEILFKKYERHKSMAKEKLIEILNECKSIVSGKKVGVALTGSASLNISQTANIPFVQEVFATRISVSKLLKDIDVVVELGGEDAKILFLTNGSEERMNGSCAGGTGAFIDQMAALLNVDSKELDLLSKDSSTIYNIASRCGVFAKSDIQPLLNQGAQKSDIARSIYQAIVSQTIAGLAQGRKLEGKVAFLGGPLTFLLGLRKQFVETLKLREENAVFPENAEFFVAIGAAMFAQKGENDKDIFENIVARIESSKPVSSEVADILNPLFKNKDEYQEFLDRHAKHSVKTKNIEEYEGIAYLGIDCGSTTTKLVLISEDCDILYQFYASNKGEPLSVTVKQLKKIYELCGDKIKIKAGSVTGYGEEQIKNILKIEYGIVETVAHYQSAKHFNPNVDFIIDIGGQDIKCFKLKEGIIDSIMLNEACSSGCGSFISTFAEAMGKDVQTFSELGTFAKHPVNLGSRCTVFMNSSVKQAQKDGATIADISAGLSISVIKNAIYKVIRANKPEDLGVNIVAQGGTFLNNAVLRAFEMELKKNVVRPNIAGLMGAYGAALYAKQNSSKESNFKGTLISKEELETFEVTTRSATCRKCTNNCKLIVTISKTGEKFISGNRCENALNLTQTVVRANAYKFKKDKLFSYTSRSEKRGKIGLPMGLNYYENLPFWHTLFSKLGFNVITSGESSRVLYELGQHTIPSDTVCYPAKIMHGHIIKLINDGVETIFYPCMPYNFNEYTGDNHYNCPVVSYYPELLKNNMDELKSVKFLFPYFAIHDVGSFKKNMCDFLKTNFGISARESLKAIKNAYKVYQEYKESLYKFGEEVISSGKKVIVLCGRPYHADGEINHGIDQLLNTLGFEVISEDCLRPPKTPHKVNVLNQWTYHARLYNASYVAVHNKNVNVVQIVSFGCGLDAITTDEMKEILEGHDKIYTQIKIDEINNLGAAKIRLRSLAHAINARK